MTRRRFGIPYVIQESETGRDIDFLDTGSIVQSEGARDAGFGRLTRDGSGSCGHFSARCSWASETDVKKSKTRRI